jgi:hypothetical protein
MNNDVHPGKPMRNLKLFNELGRISTIYDFALTICRNSVAQYAPSVITKPQAGQAAFA